MLGNAITSECSYGCGYTIIRLSVRFPADVIDDLVEHYGGRI